MPIPAYMKPVLRQWEDPNRFDKSQPRRPLRVFLDQPIASGPVDGEGEFRGYPFTGEGSTGFPPPEAVLRSLLNHQGFHILLVADSLEATGAVTLGDEAERGKRRHFPVRGENRDWRALHGVPLVRRSGRRGRTDGSQVSNH